MDLTIWTLNRATTLLQDEDAILRKLFKKKDITVHFGERNGHRQLMPSEEYFIPIPLKCIGRKYRAGDLDAEGRALLDAIIDPYAYFEDDAFDTWWNEGEAAGGDPVASAIASAFGQQRMRTPKGVGYYELIEAHENNVLIGYSQGGLVARYLAFLDRFVFKKNRVRAVITIASPNYGSPLANPDNAENVTDGLFQFLVSLFSFEAMSFGGMHGRLAESVHFQDLYEVIAAARHDAVFTASHGGDTHGATSILDTAVKWLSGLHNDRNSAFRELDIRRHGDPHSVLGLVNSERMGTAGVYTGAVITANRDLNEILRSVLLNSKAKSLVGRIKQWLKRRIVGVAEKARIFGRPLEQNLDAAGVLYAQKCLVEQLPQGTSIEIVNQRRTDYVHGLQHVPMAVGKTRHIASFWHDFIVPSVYQVLPDTPGLLGQYVNPDASHNSGQSKDFPAGRKNVEAIITLLRRLRDALED